MGSNVLHFPLWKTTSREFIKEVRRELDNGYGFTPLVGSGFSAASGILMGQEFTDYLAHTVFLLLRGGVDEPNDTIRHGSSSLSNADQPLEPQAVANRQRWCIRSQGWPPYPTASQIAEAKKWIYCTYARLLAKHGLFPYPYLDPNVIESSDDYLPSDFALIDILTNKIGDELDRDSRDELRLKSNGTFQSLSRPLVPEVLRHWGYDGDDESILHTIRTLTPDKTPRTFASTSYYSEGSVDYIQERGLRSLYDWRATLAFISEAVVDRSNGSQTLRLDTPASWIIDSFNAHITRGKRGNLGHKMLAHLVRPLRVSLFLTTNFDTLLEDTLAGLRERFEVIPVSISGGLPDPTSVRAQNCIVKLHGSRLETRADFSLDEPPNESDIHRFGEYLVPPKVCGKRVEQKRGIPSSILALGFSGRDGRIIKMIKHVLDINPEAKLYWICFNRFDRDRIESIFFEEAYRKRIVGFTTPRPDLLLYELFQELTYSLPGGGYAYQFTHLVPHHPDDDKDLKAGQQEFAKAIVDFTRKLRTTKTSADTAIVRKGWCIGYHNPAEDDESSQIVLADASIGASQSLRHALAELSGGTRCVWVELQDYKRPYMVLYELLRTIAVQLGLYQLEHVVMAPLLSNSELLGGVGDSEEGRRIFWDNVNRHVQSLVKTYFHIEPKDWVVFLYGRTVPGGCAGWDDRPWDQSGTINEHEEMDQVLAVLARRGFRVVYTPLSELRKGRYDLRNREAEIRRKEIARVHRLDVKETAENDEEEERSESVIDPFEQLRSRQAKIRAIPKTAVDPRLETRFKSWFEKHGPMQSAKRRSSGVPGMLSSVYNVWLEGYPTDLAGPKDVDESIRRSRFLYAASLFRQSRHTSAFFSEATFPCPHRFTLLQIDNDRFRADEVASWLDTLREYSVFHYKPGGYAWVYRDIRLAVQEHLQECRVNTANGSRGTLLCHTKSRVHYWIADWYRRAFFATGHSMPLIEAFYHFYRSIQYAVHAKPTKLKLTEAALDRYRCNRVRTGLLAMVKLLRVAEPWMRFWLHSPSGHPMFAHDPIDLVVRDVQAVTPEFEDVESYMSSLRSGEVSFTDDVNLEICVSSGSLREPTGSQDSSSEKQLANYAIVSLALEVLYLRNEISKRGHSDDIGWNSLIAEEFRDLLSLLRDEIYQTCLALTTEAGEGTRVAIASGMPLLVTEKDSAQRLFIDASIDRVDSNAFIHAMRDDVEDELLPGLRRDDTIGNILLNATKKFNKEANEEKDKKRLNRKRIRGICEQYSRTIESSLDKYLADNAPRIDARNQCQAASGVCEFAYLQIRRGKLQRTAEGKTGDKAEPKSFYECNFALSESSNAFMLSTALCFTALKQLRELHPTYMAFEFRETVKCLTIYGLGLGYLHRFFEAHRRLREADALVSKATGMVDRVEHGIISLRRAEVYLVEAELLRTLLVELQDFEGLNPSDEFAKKLDEASKHGLPYFEALKKDGFTVEDCCRRLTAVLGDASASLDDARRLLGGVSHSSLWWGRLAMLRLRLYATHLSADSLRGSADQYISLAYRLPIDHTALVTSVYRQGVLIRHNDPLRQVLLADVYMRARCVMAGGKDWAKAAKNLNDEDNPLKQIEMSLANLKEQVKGPVRDGKGKLRKKILKRVQQQYSSLLH